VLFTALVMIDAVRRPQLTAYRAKISLFLSQYGEKTLALLYQADVRCRQEFMPRLKLLLESEHNACIAAGRLSTYDTARPWDSVWKAAISGNLASEFWDAEYKVSALLIGSQTSRLAQALGGDAEVASSSHQPSRPATQPTKPTKPNTPPTRPNQPGPKGGLVAKTETNDNPPRQICRAYNAGNCKSMSNACLHGDRVHVCHFCLGTNHAGKDCHLLTGKNGSAKAKAKARGNKGKKGKNRWG
jgi:hypothetical protein